MKSHPEISEPFTVACDVLIDVFGRLNVLPFSPGDRDAFRRYAQADLATKSENTAHDFYNNIWQKASKALLPNSVKFRLGSSSSADSEPLDAQPVSLGDCVRERDIQKAEADIFIVTVIDVEFDAVLKVFGIDSSASPDCMMRGGKVFKTNLQRQSGSSIVVYITMIGEARNKSCVNVCRDIFEQFKVGACILVGIAGGNKEKVQLGDVVASLQLYDIEGGKSQLYFFNRFQKVQLRLESYTPPTSIKRNIQNLDPSKHKWQECFNECMAHYQGESLSKPINAEAWKAKPSFRPGIIVVGEKVLADGSLPKTAKKLSDQVFAVEMEGSGFASACNHCKVPWLDIRGISDLANPKKNDGWHVPASVAAATLTRIFLEKEYRKEAEEIMF